MLKVFLSSTGRDLRAFRDATFAAVSRLSGFHCVRMEDFTAADEQPLSFCLQRVAECDIFVGIISHCFGSAPASGHLSFTQHEYEAADGKPRLMFVSPDDFSFPGNLREPDELWERQRQFRVRVMADRIVAPFTSPDDLAARVVEALANWHRSQLDSLAPVADLPHRYRTGRTIAEGHSAVVLEGIDVVLERPVAIKMAKPGFLKDKPHYRDIFRREAKFLAMLDHPNIVPLYEYREPEDGPLIVMKPAGITLRDLAGAASGGFPLPVARIARQLAAALDYCGEQGISHRDVKPDNVLMDAAGRLFLIDFGLAARIDDARMWCAPVGAAPYLSPEVLDCEGARADTRRFCDQFSLGVTLYQLITGRLPLDPLSSHKDTARQGLDCTAARLQEGERPVPGSARDPTIPPAVDQILLRMISLSFRDRYPNNRTACEELVKALGTWELQRRDLPRVTNYLSPLQIDWFLKRAIAEISSPEALRLYATPPVVKGLESDQANLVAKLFDLSAGTYVPHRYCLEITPDLLPPDEFEKSDEPGNAADRLVLPVAAGIAPPLLVLDPTKCEAMEMEMTLSGQVIGQDEAIAVLSRAVRAALTRSGTAGRPLGVFLFIGPPGVGRGRLARELASFVFGNDDALSRFEMGRFASANDAIHLLGECGEPSALGSEEGLLWRSLRNRPRGVILLDELEKAHRRVQEELARAFSNDRIIGQVDLLSDTSGTFFVLTSNLGSSEPGFQTLDREALRASVRAWIYPPLLEQVTEIVRFVAFADEDLIRVLDLIAAERIDQVRARSGITVTLRTAVKEFILGSCRGGRANGHSLRRSLDRLVMEKVVNAPCLLPGVTRADVDLISGEIVVTAAVGQS